MTIPPMTSEEAAAFLKGVEWMKREAKEVARDRGRDRWTTPKARQVALEIWGQIAAIPAPTVPSLGFGVLGEG